MKISFKLSRFTLVLWGTFLIGLSILSDYDIYKSVGDINYEIATMLTPMGIINNLYIEDEHYLKPYYSKLIQSRTMKFADLSFALSYLFAIIFACYNLYKIKNERE